MVTIQQLERSVRNLTPATNTYCMVSTLTYNAIKYNFLPNLGIERATHSDALAILNGMSAYYS